MKTLDDEYEKNIGQFHGSESDLDDIDSAKGFADLSRRWASEDYGTSVDGVEYSSKHYATDSKESSEVSLEAAEISVNASNVATDGATNAKQSEDNAKVSEDNAKQSEDNIYALVDGIDDVVDAAIESVVNEGNTQVTRVTDEGDTQVNRVAIEGRDQTQAVNDAGDHQVGEVNYAGDVQTARLESHAGGLSNILTSEADAHVERIGEIGEVVEQDLIRTGDIQVLRVRNEGDIQAGRAEAEADRAEDEANRAQAEADRAETEADRAESAAIDLDNAPRYHGYFSPEIGYPPPPEQRIPYQWFCLDDGTAGGIAWTQGDMLYYAPHPTDPDEQDGQYFRVAGELAGGGDPQPIEIPDDLIMQVDKKIFFRDGVGRLIQAVSLDGNDDLLVGDMTPNGDGSDGYKAVNALGLGAAEIYHIEEQDADGAPITYHVILSEKNGVTLIAFQAHVNDLNNPHNVDYTQTGAAAAVHGHEWSEISSIPVYAERWPTFTEVTDKPNTYPPSSHTHLWEEITDSPEFANRWPTFDEVTDKPITFPPSTHSHPWEEVTEKPAQATRWPTAQEVTAGEFGDGVTIPGSQVNGAVPSATTATNQSGGSVNATTGDFSAAVTIQEPTEPNNPTSLSWVQQAIEDAPGGLPEANIVTADFTAEFRESYLINAESIVATLPTGVLGMIVYLGDYAEHFSPDTPCTVRSDSLIEGSDSDYLLTIPSMKITMQYVDAETGWRVMDGYDVGSVAKGALVGRGSIIAQGTANGFDWTEYEDGSLHQRGVLSVSEASQSFPWGASFSNRGSVLYTAERIGNDTNVPPLNGFDVDTAFNVSEIICTCYNRNLATGVAVVASGSVRVDAWAHGSGDIVKELGGTAVFSSAGNILGSIQMFPPTLTAAPNGHVFAEGQLLDRDEHSELFGWAARHNQLVTEAEWQDLLAASPNGTVAVYSSGTTVDNFRVPVLHHFSSGVSPSSSGELRNGFNSRVGEHAHAAGALATISNGGHEHTISPCSDGYNGGTTYVATGVDTAGGTKSTNTAGEHTHGITGNTAVHDAGLNTRPQGFNVKYAIVARHMIVEEDDSPEPHPVGSVVLRMDDINPSVFYGGTWDLMTGDATLSFGDGTARDGAVVGGNSHTLTAAQMPSHTHTGPSHTHTMAHTHSTPNHTHGLGRTSTQRGTWAQWNNDNGSSGVHSTGGYANRDLATDSGGAGTTGASSAANTGAGGTGATGAAGSGEAHNIQSARILINVWRRTA